MTLQFAWIRRIGWNSQLEAEVNISNSHRAHGGCDLSTEDAYSSKAPDPIHLWYLQRSVQARCLLWIVPFAWSRYWFGLRIFRLLDWTHWFWLWVPFPWSRHTDFDYWILICALNRVYGRCERSTGDAYSLTPDPTSGFSKGPCLLNFLNLYFIRDLWDWSLSVILFFHSDGKKKWQFGVKDGDIHKLNFILNLEFWSFNKKAHAGQASEYWIEIAKDPKSYKMQVEKLPSLIF
jgi:hypothetical protein